MAAPAPAWTANQTIMVMPTRTNAPTDSSMLDCFMRLRLICRDWCGGDDIVAKAAHNAIVGGGELGGRSLEVDPALFEQDDAIAGGHGFRDIMGHHHGGK